MKKAIPIFVPIVSVFILWVSIFVTYYGALSVNNYYLENYDGIMPRASSVFISSIRYYIVDVIGVFGSVCILMSLREKFSYLRVVGYSIGFMLMFYFILGFSVFATSTGSCLCRGWMDWEGRHNHEVVDESRPNN